MSIHDTRAANKPDFIYFSKITIGTAISKILHMKEKASAENNYQTVYQNLKRRTLLHKQG